MYRSDAALCTVDAPRNRPNTLATVAVPTIADGVVVPQGARTSPASASTTWPGDGARRRWARAGLPWRCSTVLREPKISKFVSRRLARCCLLVTCDAGGAMARLVRKFIIA
jgi:hypothetical protein